MAVIFGGPEAWGCCLGLVKPGVELSVPVRVFVYKAGSHSHLFIALLGWLHHELCTGLSQSRDFINGHYGDDCSDPTAGKGSPGSTLQMVKPCLPFTSVMLLAPLSFPLP